MYGTVNDERSWLQPISMEALVIVLVAVPLTNALCMRVMYVYDVCMYGCMYGYALKELPRTSISTVKSAFIAAGEPAVEPFTMM